VRQKGWWQITCTWHMAQDEQLTDHRFEPDHPLAPMRVELTMRLAPSVAVARQKKGNPLRGRPVPV